MKQVSGKKSSYGHERNMSNSQINNYISVKVENDGEEQGTTYPRSITPNLHQYKTHMEKDLRNKYANGGPEASDQEISRSN